MNLPDDLLRQLQEMDVETFERLLASFEPTIRAESRAQAPGWQDDLAQDVRVELYHWWLRHRGEA